MSEHINNPITHEDVENLADKFIDLLKAEQLPVWAAKEVFSIAIRRIDKYAVLK